MTKFYNVTTPVEGTDGKTRFHKVGVAFPQGDRTDNARLARPL